MRLSDDWMAKDKRNSNQKPKFWLFPAIILADTGTCVSHSVSSSKPHMHTLFKNSLCQAGGSFSDIWVWYKSVARSAGLSRMCLYSIIDWQSFTVTEKTCRSGMAKMHFWLHSSCSHQSRGHRVYVGPVKRGRSFPRFWVYLTPSQARGLSRVIGAVNLEEQRRYSEVQSNKDKQ